MSSLVERLSQSYDCVDKNLDHRERLSHFHCFFTIVCTLRVAGVFWDRMVELDGMFYASGMALC
jgi:hypothetical protein